MLAVEDALLFIWDAKVKRKKPAKEEILPLSQSSFTACGRVGHVPRWTAFAPSNTT
ncbi:hypothetical protein SAMN05216411_10962 [Nitrosospira multiformis]|nr:hypothetical protein SAMN05216411_10962 [Nitrosospira multiformis]